MTDYYPDWPPMVAGDRVIIRDRATARERIAIVRALLAEAEGEGPGFVDDTGATIRLFHYTASTTHTHDEKPQAVVDEIFCELTSLQHYRQDASRL